MTVKISAETTRRLGIARAYDGPEGRKVSTDRQTLSRLVDALSQGADGLPSRGSGAATLKTLLQRRTAATPCWLPQWLEGGRAWGIALQLYELRSARNWGIGDIADLAAFCRIAGAAGADFVGTNPLHALFLADPERCSPFSPSSRQFLNPLYIAVDRIPGFAEDDVDEAALERLRRAELVDYAGVAALKLGALRRIWKRRSGGDGVLDDFARRGGEALRRHALFEALSAHRTAEGLGAGWKGWPEPYQDPSSEAVTAFANTHDDTVRFHIWLQWLADRQLAEAIEAAADSGMRIGLYLDIAVGDAPDGSATWSEAGSFVEGFHVGAPPDVFSENGQDWGLAPLNPAALRGDGARQASDLFEASMRRAGALRIDHAMALWHLFLVPEGGSAAEGAYVRYPSEALLDRLAELSARYRSILIGEDLGHVPAGFREVMEAARILSYRILYFEQGKRGFKRPKDYPALALACLSTHDLPTLRAWWRGDDVRLRAEHGLVAEEAAEAQFAARDAERLSLVAALKAAKLLDGKAAAAARESAGQADEPMPDALVVAVHRYIARTPALLAGVRLADLTGETAPTNLPGTVDSYPNWRVRSSVALEDLSAQPLFREILEAVAAERPRNRP